MAELVFSQCTLSLLFLWRNGALGKLVWSVFLSVNPTKMVKHIQTIHRVCLTILWGWRVKGKTYVPVI